MSKENMIKWMQARKGKVTYDMYHRLDLILTIAVLQFFTQ